MSPRSLKAFMAAAPAARRLGFVGLETTAPDAQGNGGPEVGRTPQHRKKREGGGGASVVGRWGQSL